MSPASLAALVAPVALVAPPMPPANVAPGGVATAAAGAEITINWVTLSPVVIVLGAAIVSTLIEAAAARRRPRPSGPAQPAYLRPLQAGLALVAVAAAGLMALRLALEADKSMGLNGDGAVVIDPVALYLQLAVACCALLALLVVADRTVQGESAFAPQAAAVPGSEYEAKARQRRLSQTDVYPLVLFATGGMMLFPAAGDLITLFVALEVLSLPLYLLSGMARHRRLWSQEASLKYFLLGAFGSAFFLFGAAWVYGATGALRLSGIAAAVQSPTGLDPILVVGVVLMLVGLFFKVGAAPFHSWTPDVYQGAPTPITGFMAACTKIAAFGALLRIVYAVFQALEWDLRPVLWTVAILTMVVGTVIGLVQKDVKRLLAYSAIAHAGFILVGVTSLTAEGLSGSLFYLFTYGIASVGGFGVIALVREVDAEGHMRGEATGLDQWRGLGRRSPVLAGAFAIFLLSFAGIPLTSGFVAKFAVFAAAFGAGAPALAIIGLACSAAAACFYARVIVAMFFEPAPGGEAAVGAAAEVGAAGLAGSALAGSGLGGSGLGGSGLGGSGLGGASPGGLGADRSGVGGSGLGIGVRTLGLTQIAIAVSLAFTLVLGLVPGWFLHFTQELSQLLS
ncbi:MAG: NADH-quinone oxidoreductase subunit NuoN [Bifidobacteriaceae bacterium]|jgi:NADH-quinone oxidoreductase subunit N|nr:NADH-quinone oxidoreductase subunit NuoN [Bifidobacteriaceae bacterium]